MSRLVLLFSYSDVLASGPVSLGFGSGIRGALPAEADVSFVVECNDKYPCVISHSMVISAGFKYGELSLELADLMSFAIGFTAEGEIDRLDYLFSPADTPSSTKLTISCEAPAASIESPGTSQALIIRGIDRPTGEHFEYAYLSSMQSASRVPVQSIHHINSEPPPDQATRR